MASRLKTLGLTAALAGASALSGCGYIAGYLIADDVAHTIANGQRDAARIAAGESNRNDDHNAVRINSFSCAGIFDHKNDGIINTNSDEIREKGKTTFYVGDTYAYVVIAHNCKGSTLKLYSQEAPGMEIKERRTKIIDSDDYLYYIKGTLKEPANWHAYFTVDGTKINDLRIRVLEDPARTAKK